MTYRFAADLVVTLHFAFLIFVVLGGFLVRRYRWLLLPHLAAIVWAVYVEAAPGIVCPLTPIENRYAALAGEVGYRSGFVEHYLVPVIYPDGLTRAAQWGLAVLVAGVNAAVYLGGCAQRRTGPRSVGAAAGEGT
jgi:hypothetical protein